jgi:hypothetical protein
LYLVQAWVTTDTLSPPDAIAREMARYGGLALAIAALANDGSPLLTDLLAYQSALAEQADPARRIARLRAEALDLDARAEPNWEEAAEMHGKAAHRRLQGEHDLAAAFLRRAHAAERFAAALEADAFARSLEATHLQAALQRRGGIVSLLEELAA